MTQDPAAAGRPVVVITGATSGIGELAAIDLARRGMHLVLTARNRRRADLTVARIRQAAPAADVDIVDADFTDLAGTRDAGTEIVERFERFDTLINNAGVHTMNQRTTNCGLPEMITVNYLAPWLFTGTVLPALRRADQARIITVASEASRRHGLLKIPEDLTDIRPFNALQSSPIYGKTKLLDIMFSLELADRLAGTAVSATCLNPGYNTTGLGRELPFAATLERILHALNIGDPDHGAGLIVQLATEGGLESGGYYSGRSARRVTPVAPGDDPTARRRLWQATAELLSARGFSGIYPETEG
ncbi:short-chain dehydrogenase [Mycobacterium sp. Root265]|uniref:SDR family NAD(P)-dependent oxidoreductase n=1 Tax=Mycobacterium sp. Root265 TaxID=1736504 RepID=UPI00070D2CDB|nr:SDR family NAD(P)-dependent oxidoreductase [Mycobacterium sp. Root265]KRD07701.1 short-chain dehydrogenase [Mycobacterium sp. Root265]